MLRNLIADIANSVVIETLTIESAHGGDKFSQHVLLQAVRVWRLLGTVAS